MNDILAPIHKQKDGFDRFVAHSMEGTPGHTSGFHFQESSNDIGYNIVDIMYLCLMKIIL